MPRSPAGDRGSAVIDRACDALKLCRHQWTTWPVIADQLGYAQRSNAQRLVVSLYRNGFVERRKRGLVYEYRVAPAWRNE